VRARPAYDFEARLFIYLAVSHFRLGHQDEAEVAIERAVELGGDDPDAFYCRAEIFQRRDVARSIADLERYLEMTRRLVAEGGVVAASKQERVRRMLEHLRAVQRGEERGDEIFDPVGEGPVALRFGQDRARFALGALACGLVVLVATKIGARRRARP
jgi:hypothetical protein